MPLMLRTWLLLHFEAHLFLYIDDKENHFGRGTVWWVFAIFFFLNFWPKGVHVI
jgi:hypothetical protein